MALEASQPLKLSLPVSAALAQALYNEWAAATTTNFYGGAAATQYTFVKLGAVNSFGTATCDVIAATADIPIGVIQNAPFIVAQGTSQLGGSVAEIVVIGVTKLAIGGTVTLAQTSNGAVNMIETTSAGLGVAAGAVTGGSKTVMGQFLANGVSGDHVKALINCTIPLPTGN